MATGLTFHIEGDGDRLAGALRRALGPAPLPCLVNADAEPQLDALVARSTAFATALTDGAEALVVTILRAAPPGLGQFARHGAAAALWAFTRQAALDWAPRGIRVNAIGLGAAPFGPGEPTASSSRAAADVPADPANLADLVRTLHALAGFRSMTGQIIRLGGPLEPQCDLPPRVA